MAGGNVVAAAGSEVQDWNGHFSGSLSNELFSPVIFDKSDDTPTSLYRTLRLPGFPDNLMTGPVVMNTGSGWQEIVMPVVITNPGCYRISDNYTATSAETGLLILSSNVIIDGNGHSFTGNTQNSSIGVVAISNETSLANISVTNLLTETCYIGIIFDHITGGEISHTRHNDALAGILTYNSKFVNVSNNTVTGSRVDEYNDGVFGIVGMNSQDLIFESNIISDTTPSVQDITSYGVCLINCTKTDVKRNEIYGPINMGIFSELFDGFKADQLDISDNQVLFADMYGIAIVDGQGIINNNSVGASGYGILLMMDNSTVTSNHIYDNLKSGLVILGANLTLSSNNLMNNTINFWIEGEKIDNYLHHIDRTNIVDGRPIIYLRETSDDSIGLADDPAMVIVASSDNVSIQNVTTGANYAGIILANVTNATVSRVSDVGSLAGLVTFWSHDTSITDSISSKNKELGYGIFDSAGFNVTRCDISDTSGIGYLIHNSEMVYLNSCHADDFNQTHDNEDLIGIMSDTNSFVVIENSSISGKPYNGISLINTDNLSVNTSFIADSKEDGVYCADSREVSVNNSILAGNKRTGISLVNSTGFLMNRNFILGNAASGLSLNDAKESKITDNFFNNTRNVEFSNENPDTRWNITLTPGKNIMGGSYLGGNFWANPEGSGFSQTHPDRGDGICNAPFVMNYDNIDHLPLTVPSGLVTPDFIADQYSGTPPLTIRFTDKSTGSPTQWNWTFGDGSRSYEQNPVHTFNGIGRYSVTLEVTGKNGNQGTLRKPGLIDVNSGRVTGPNGMLWVTSNPQNATIFLDGKFIGQTPLKATGIRAGSHQIMATYEGYQKWTGRVQVIANQFTYVPKILLRREYV